VTTAAKDTSVREELKLVGDGLGLHANRLGQLADAELTRTCQGMKHAQPRAVGEDFE
jgi:hypothetical protein